MPSDADYYVMGLARNPEQFSASQREHMQEVIREEIQAEREQAARLKAAREAAKAAKESK